MEKIDIAKKIANLIVEVHNEKLKALEENEKEKYNSLSDIEYNLIEDLNAMNFDIDYKYTCIGFKLFENVSN
ncbi:MAG: hypothetical protein ACI4XN_07285 [Candidatus Kurthia intestinigallinarum]